jgi:DNA-binding NtrC family response regulator
MTVNRPRVLVIDDLFGRVPPNGRNEERASLCAQLLLADITGDQPQSRVGQIIKKPIADTVFFRGQTPARAVFGDFVENDLEGCLKIVRSGWTDRGLSTPPWAMVLVDLCFYTGKVTARSERSGAGMAEGRREDDEPNSYFGLTILKALREECPDLPVVILSSKPRDAVSRVISAEGALGFIPRGEPTSRQILEDYLERHGLVPDATGRIVGLSIALLKTLRSARRVAGTKRNVLLQGESGTGKELLAAYLHAAGTKSVTRPWVVVDSGALSPELYGSELFGHVRGAFTGAVGERIGRIAQADGGDLFLDEIGNMPGDVQAGLLRVLQNGVVVPVGAERGQQVDIRVLSATNEDIEGKALTGQFRGDLLDRLRTGGAFILPPLRQRREDIPLLARHFLSEALGDRPGAIVREISPEAMEALAESDWPGNIRALESAVRKAVADHPDMEYLFPLHFDIRARASTMNAASTGPSKTVGAVPKEESLEPLADLARIVNAMDDPRIEDTPVPGLIGVLPRLEAAYARLTARLLRASLSATARHTPGEPEGKVLIHPSLKLLVGDPNLPASKAADLIKRILGLQPEALGNLMESRLLREAQERALSLRPTGGKGTRRPPRPRV